MRDAKTYHCPITLFDPESAHVVLEPLEAGQRPLGWRAVRALPTG